MSEAAKHRSCDALISERRAAAGGAGVYVVLCVLCPTVGYHVSCVGVDRVVTPLREDKGEIQCVTDLSGKNRNTNGT